jgi:proline iminopeptidase
MRAAGVGARRARLATPRALLLHTLPAGTHPACPRGPEIRTAWRWLLPSNAKTPLARSARATTARRPAGGPGPPAVRAYAAPEGIASTSTNDTAPTSPVDASRSGLRAFPVFPSALNHHPLFPEIEPEAAGRLAVDTRHALYWESSGNPYGVPVVFLHGGPGGGCLPHHRRFFDPGYWRIILFDQRGAGRSIPYAELADNTTWHLIADMERLRAHLKVERWLLFGGSWGSTLALAYAQAYPERCLGLVLRGVFLARPAEIDWFMEGMRIIFPEAWRAFAEFLPEHERVDLLDSYHRRLIDPDPAVHLPAAAAWDRYEGACVALLPEANPTPRNDDATASLAIARIEAHYFVNRAFLANDELLQQIDRIRHLPCTIVQGRYDVVCPPVTADTLSCAWPEAEYIVVPDAGHSIREPGVTRALVAAMERMRGRLAGTDGLRSAPR